MGQKSIRVHRVEKEIHHLAALYLSQNIPEAIPALASVTAVDVTSDLRKAVVYFRLIGSHLQVEEARKVLETHRKGIQKQVADLRLKFCPVLEFRFGIAKAEDEVDQMLAQFARNNRWSADGGDET